MNQATYLKERIDDQINWYNRKSKFNQNRYKLLKTMVIALSVTIPFLVGMVNDDRGFLKITIGIFGVLVAMIEGILSLYKYHDLWLQYRLSAEALQQEKLRFLTETGEYANNPDAFKTFVSRSETIMGSENKTWMEALRKQDVSKG